MLKKCGNLAANSILESVIALSIISVCLYMAILVFSAVFTQRTSTRFYGTQNKVNELFFLSQLKIDSLVQGQTDQLVIENEAIGDDLSKISVTYKDSSNNRFEKVFYIRNNE